MRVSKLMSKPIR